MSAPVETPAPASPVARLAKAVRGGFDRVTLKPGSVALVAGLAIVTAVIGAVLTEQLEGGKGCSPLPVALIRLEVTFWASRFITLFNGEGACAANVTRSLYTWDVLFPLVYGPFLSAVYLWTERWRRFDKTNQPIKADGSVRRDLIVLAPLAAAALDILVENPGLLVASWFVGRGADDPLLIIAVQLASLGALIKWLLLALVTSGILVELVAGPRGAVLWRTRFSVLAVLLGAAPLLAVAQGRDILQRLFEGDHPAWRLLAAVPPLLFAAAAIWYCGRKLTELDLGQGPAVDEWYKYFGRYIPRLLGTTALVLPGLAFARVADAQGTYVGAAFAGFLVAFLLRRLAKGRIVDAIGRFLLPRSPEPDEAFVQRVGQVVVATLVAAWFPFFGPAESRYLRAAAYLCLVGAWLFQLFVTFRRQRRTARLGKNMDLKLDHVRLHEIGRGLQTAVFAGALLSLALLALYTVAPVRVGRALGPLWILCLAVSNAVFVGSVLVWAGRRFRVPIVTIALLLMVLFSLWNDSHIVRTIAAPGAAPIGGRPTIEAAFETWLQSAHPGTPRENVPVVLVAGAGGGLRAAYWTAMSLAAIADDIPSFDTHVFAFSGVSGGSLGGALFAALAEDRQRQAGKALPCKEPVAETGRLAAGTTGPYATCVRDFMRDDFLTPVVSKLVAPDFLQLFLPFAFTPFDRSAALEGSWEASYRRSTGQDTFANGFLAFAAAPRATAPVLIFNSTHVETGRRYLASSVSPRTADGKAHTLHDAGDVLDALKKDMPLSTAVHNSARFTYVSPSGHMTSPHPIELGRLVDGGYFENSGLATLGEVYEVLRRRGVTPYVLYLCNDPSACTGQPTPTKVTSEAADEIASPFRAVYKARDARGSLALASLKAEAGESHFLQLNVCSELPVALPSTAGESAEDQDAVKKAARQKVVSPPLGWLLSKQARDWMDTSLAFRPAGGTCYAQNTRVIAALRDILARP